MGIYDSRNIFGIRIYNYNDDELTNILFEKKYDEVMSDEQKKEAYLFYTELNKKNKIHFQYYIECINRDGKEVFLMWFPLALNTFLKKFNV